VRSQSPQGVDSTTSYVPLFEFSRGGMGRVELALLAGPRFRRLYAIKRLHPHHAEDPAVREMFLEEGRLAGLVRHPNVVSVLDVGEDREGPFLVMDYVDGVSAADLLAQARRSGEAVPIAVCVRIALDAARGLHAAHELRDPSGKALALVHRDVSPQNVLVGFDGLARVSDFGVAKALGSGSRTSTGLLKGKMGYMAPERLRFEPPDRRSDLFSLGVVLHELLTGDRLYTGAEAADVARQILNDPPPDPGLSREDVPAAVTELVFELLAKDPALRPASAAEVAERLELVAEALASEAGAPVDVGAFLTSRFSDERAARERRIAEATAAMETRRHDERSGPWRRARIVWLALAGVLIVAGATAWRVTRASGGAPVTVVAPPAVTAPAEIAPPPAPAAAATPVTAAPRPPARRVRAAKAAAPVRAKPSPPKPAGVRHWDWQ
jgi:serine/threonine-protein kinase